MKNKLKLERCIVLICILTKSILLVAQPITYDSSFNKSGRRICEYCPYNPPHYLSAVLLNPDQSIVSVGEMGGGGKFAVKLKPNGDRDSSFGDKSNQPWGFVHGVNTIAIVGSGWYDNSTNAACLQTDGKILVCGSTLDSNFLQNLDGNIWIMRLNANGFLDTSFANKGHFIFPIVVNSSFVTASKAYDIGVLPNGNIVICGFYFGANSFLLELKPDGVIDSTFGNNGFAFLGNATNSYLGCLNVLPSGSIIAGGQTTTINTNSSAMLFAKFTASGKIDSTFGTNGILIQDIDSLEEGISDIKLTSDNRIVFSGFSSEFDPVKSIDSVITNCLVGRIDTNGLLDNSFNNTGYKVFNANNGQYVVRNTKVEVQADGKLVLMCTTYGPYMQFGILDRGYQPSFARFNVDGSLDMSFNSTGYINLASEPNTLTNEPLDFVIQNDNKIVYVGVVYDESQIQPFSFIGRLHNYFSVGLGSPIISALNQSVVFPNPAQNTLNVQYNCNNEAGVFSLYNAIGVKVLELALSKNSNMVSGNVQQLPNGVYFYKAVFAGCGTETGKLIINR